jgi:hypothetical protein
MDNKQEYLEILNKQLNEVEPILNPKNEDIIRELTLEESTATSLLLTDIFDKINKTNTESISSEMIEQELKLLKKIKKIYKNSIFFKDTF